MHIFIIFQENQQKQTQMHVYIIMHVPIQYWYVNTRSWEHPDKQLVALIARLGVINSLQEKQAQGDDIIKRVVCTLQMNENVEKMFLI